MHPSFFPRLRSGAETPTEPRASASGPPRSSKPASKYRAGKVGAAAALFLLLGACAVGPKYKRPAAPVPPSYKEQTEMVPGGNDQWKAATPREGELRGDWWELFGDQRLSDLERKVVISNQNVKQAEANFRQARALVALNHANYYPTLNTQPAVTSSYTSSNLGSHRLGGNQVFTLTSIPFGASWEPNLWGRVSLAVQNAAAGAQASAADLENMRLSMQADLASDYFQMEGIDMEERLLRDTIGAYEQALQLTVDRFNSGVASKADVVQAQAQLESTRAQFTDLGVTRSQLEHAIAVLVGEPPSTFSLARGEIHGTPPPIPTGLPSQLLERRPDIAAAERQMAAANAQIGLAQVAYYPLVGLGANGGVESGTITTLLSWPSRFWSLGPSVAQTILDFGRRHAQTQQTEAVYDATIANYRQTVLAAFQDVEDNLVALRLLAQEAVQQQAAVDAAEQSVHLETEQYKAGTVSYLNVITTQTIALTDQRSAVGILQRRMTAAVQLIRALGGGWNASSLPSPAALQSAAKAKPAALNREAQK